MQSPQDPVRIPHYHRWTVRAVSPWNAQLRILVVDDVLLGAQAVSTALSMDGYTTFVAGSGAEALVSFGRNRPHIVLMDVTMPGCDGIQAAGYLRKLPGASHLVIIAYTSLLESSVKARMDDQEFDGYCQKGEPVSHLVDLIESTRN